MCKFCDMEIDNCVEIASVRNDFGILGEAANSIYIWRTEDDYEIDAGVSGIFGNAEEATVKIKFCPMCGRKLV